MKLRTLVITLVLFFGVLPLTLGLAIPTDDDTNRAAAVTVESGHPLVAHADDDMLEEHRDMLEVMRVDSSAAMRERMNRDPMWQMLRTSGWARLDEQHQANIDRMLGLAGQ